VRGGWSMPEMSEAGLRAPDDDPGLITFPVPAARIQRRARLAGLISEYRQAA
jgi:hypothetical protein